MIILLKKKGASRIIIYKVIQISSQSSYIKRRITMIYTCQNCGVAADTSSSLCNPTDVIEDNLCGISRDKVCEDKLMTMKYVPPQLEMDNPAVCIKGLGGGVLSPLGLIGP
jgi:hypothetical protein